MIKLNQTDPYLLYSKGLYNINYSSAVIKTLKDRISLLTL